MGLRTVNLDKEAEEILENKKQKNPDFNFSQFIQDALKNTNQRPELTYEQILEKQRQYQVKLTEIDSEMDYLDKARRKIEVKMQEEKDNAIKKQMQEEKKAKEKMESRIDNFMYFYKDITRPMAVELAEEFEQLKGKQNMWEFLDGKGYKQKEQNELEDDK